jgi:hypothetical protein
MRTHIDSYNCTEMTYYYHSHQYVVYLEGRMRVKVVSQDVEPLLRVP